MAQLARQHNDVNVLSIPSKYVEPEQARAIVQSWLSARFEGGRHARRLEKIGKLETPRGRPTG
jgi:RpiB/LacA/LacB family sugar-phosphate isomerase